MVQKIRAAADARIDSDLIIVARTDAIAVNGFDDAMERANAYIEAGADMTFVEAPRTLEEIAAIPKLAVPQLLNIVAGGLTPMLSRAELENMGYALVLYANAALQAAVAGMQAVLEHLKAQGSLDGVSDKVAGFAERQRLVNKPHFDALEKKYS
jgi:2-methylisocitrate lyase-like PEP mutase family enzyme